MLRFLVLLGFLSFSLAASEDIRQIYPLSYTEIGPMGFIHNVNVLTGEFVHHEVDLVIAGAEPFVLERNYSNLIGWHRPDEAYAILSDYSKSKKNYEATCYYCEPGAMSVLLFSKGVGHGDAFRANFSHKESKGLTNFGRGRLSAETNPINFKLDINQHWPGQAEMRFGDGTKSNLKLYKKLDGDKKATYEIVGKIKPNGSSLSYTKRVGFISIESKSKMDETYGSLQGNFKIIDRDTLWQDEWSDHLGREVIASRAPFIYREWISPTEEKEHWAWRISKVVRPNAPTVRYEYQQEGKNIRMEKIIHPDRRHLRIAYYGKGENKGKVESLWVSDKKRGEVQTHLFKYKERKRDDDYRSETDVHHPVTSDKLMKFITTTDDRINSVRRYTKRGQSDHEAICHRYIWGEKAGLLGKAGHLAREEIDPGSGQEHFLVISYKYDDSGNVIEETRTQDHETAVIRRAYDNSEYHLLLREEVGDRVFQFEYIPGTPLLAAKFVGDGTKIYQREFFAYDREAIQISYINDDGCHKEPSDLTGVTERRITYTKPKQKTPCKGLPEEVRECYLDLFSGEEKQLRRIVNHYTIEGWISQQDIFDANDQFAYSTTTTFHKFGLPLIERDPLGQEVQKAYDENGNLIREVKGSLSKEMVYDYSNRLTDQVETHGDKKITRRFEYDIFNQKIAEWDTLGSKTSFEYDLAGRLIKTTLPNGGVVEKEYDPLDRVILEKNPNGKIKRISYGIHNKPVKIIYPDGTLETFEYDKNGAVIKTLDRSNTTTYYANDALGREIERHCEEQHSYKEYSGFQLKKEIDPDGVITTHSYDGAGRKTATKCGERLISLSYDALGRLFETHEWLDGTRCRITRNIYDLLNRPVEEQLLDDTGKVFSSTRYQYDENGNRTHSIVGDAVTETVFDGWARPLEVIDPLGHISRIDYKEEIGQLIRTTTDPMGVYKIERINSLGHLLSSDTYTPFGGILEVVHFVYDKMGNCLSSNREVFAQESKIHSILTEWEYNSDNQVVVLREASGARVTYTEYTKFGEKERVIKPDGVELLYSYNPLHLVETIQSKNSMHPVSYRYHYTPSGQIARVDDLLHHTTTTRHYNAHKQVISETLDTNLSLHTTYDNFGRPIAICYPDGSEVSYSYDAFHMRSVTRNGYTHHYHEYSEQGHLLKSSLGGYERNLLGQITASSLPHCEQKEIKYDANGNRLERRFNGKLEIFTYDYLNQLTREPDYIYSYDSVGNRLEKNEKKFTFNTLNQMDGLSYDRCGNLTQYNEAKLIYDAFDRLVEVETATETHHYRYDPFHRRVSGDNKQYLFQGDLEVGCYEDHVLVQFRVLGHGLGAEVGASTLFELNGISYIPLHNDSGSVIALLDLSHNLVERYEDSTFGEGESGKLSPWRFLSKRQDPETELFYFGRRYYSAPLARWITTDPKGYSEGPNLYAYVRNNPLLHLDLFGLERATVSKRELFRDLPRISHGPNLGNRPYPSPGEIPYCLDWERDFAADRRSRVFTIPGKESDAFAITATNGIWNSPEDALETGYRFSQICGDQKVDMIYNATDSGLMGKPDKVAQSAFALYHWIMMPAAIQLQQKWMEILTENPNRYILHFCHSDGATQTRNALIDLPTAMRDRIINRPFGPAAFIHPDLCRNVEHCISNGDFIYKFDFRGCDLIKDTARFFKPHPDAGLFDHSIASPTFDEVLQSSYNAFLNDYIR